MRNRNLFESIMAKIQPVIKNLILNENVNMPSLESSYYEKIKVSSEKIVNILKDYHCENFAVNDLGDVIIYKFTDYTQTYEDFEKIILDLDIHTDLVFNTHYDFLDNKSHYDVHYAIFPSGIPESFKQLREKMKPRTKFWFYRFFNGESYIKSFHNKVTDTKIEDVLPDIVNYLNDVFKRQGTPLYARNKFGKRTIDDSPYSAIVIYYTSDDSLYMTIRITQNILGECETCRSIPLCGERITDFDIDNYKKDIFKAFN